MSIRKSFIFLFVLVAALFMASSAKAETADEAYQSAHECYAKLSSDAAAQKLRSNWDKCIEEFRHVVKKFARGGKGAEAQFSLGRLYEELAANSKNKADWTAAIREYQTYARQHTGSNLADDAYFKAGVIYWERLHDKDNAKANLFKVIKFYKDGDMAGEASKYMKSIDAGVVPDAPPRVKEVATSKLTIVIDPGHGGTDTGAVGPDGTPEKDLTLTISKKLAEQLKKEIKDAHVFLTRDGDATLTLDDRVRFANTKKADYFISIHANASTSKNEHGIQTYYLNNASDDAADRLAKQENKNSGKKQSALDKIVSTMIQNASTDESRELARSVHKNLVGGLAKKYSDISDQKVRSALFYVLVGVKCPSILVETSYITNPKEEKRLKEKNYQSVVTAGIAKGIDNYLHQTKPPSASL